MMRSLHPLPAKIFSVHLEVLKGAHADFGMVSNAQTMKVIHCQPKDEEENLYMALRDDSGGWDPITIGEKEILLGGCSCPKTTKACLLRQRYPYCC